MKLFGISGYCQFGEHSKCGNPSCACDCHKATIKPVNENGSVIVPEVPASNFAGGRVIDNLVWHPDGMFTMSGHDGLDKPRIMDTVRKFQATQVHRDRRAWSVIVQSDIGKPEDQTEQTMRIVSFRRIMDVQLGLSIPWSMERELL